MAQPNKTVSFEERIEQIKEDLFLYDPAYFTVLCLYNIKYSNECGIRVDRNNIYFNPEYFSDKSDEFLMESVKIELFRCILAHPYRMSGLDKTSAYIASNILIANNMQLRAVKINGAVKGIDPKKECFETIYNAVAEESKKDKESYCNGRDDMCDSLSDVENRVLGWTDDAAKTSEMTSVFEKIKDGNLWGSMSGDMKNLIEKSMSPQFNYKTALHMFKMSLQSPERYMTRMRPNRRTPNGFGTMGSRRKETTKLLIAMDSSGSIPDSDYMRLLGFIEGMFSTDIQEIWTVQWDTEVKEDTLERLVKKPDKISRRGYGGTDISCIFTWLKTVRQKYDGCIIFTDGFFQYPNNVPVRIYGGTKFLFVINNAENYRLFSKKKDFYKIGNIAYLLS